MTLIPSIPKRKGSYPSKWNLIKLKSFIHGSFGEYSVTSLIIAPERLKSIEISRFYRFSCYIPLALFCPSLLLSPAPALYALCRNFRLRVLR
jgi:hypothetical protein